MTSEPVERRTKVWLGAAAFVVVGLVAGVASLRRAHPERTAWPDPSAPLVVAPLSLPPAFGTRRIFLDAGHGAPNNPGNTSALCEREQDFTRSLARDVAAALSRSGPFEVRLSRSGGELVPYAERVQAARAWHAGAFVSLHSDVRGRSEPWSPAPGQSCLRNHDAPGFSVLWSDDATEPLRSRRKALAENVATELGAMGLLPYRGKEYHADYAADAGHAGVFVDRHPHANRIFVLWRPSMPSVIVETHNARDDREVLRFREPATRRAFARALARALVRTLTPALSG